MKDATTARAPRNWLGLLSFVIAVASVAAFMGVMSVSGPFPKSIAYGDNLLYEVYIQSPRISLVAGALAVAMGIIALLRASSVLWTAIVGAIVGIALFSAVMIASAQMSSALSPPDALAVASSPTIALSPPAIGMASLVIGLAVVLGTRRGVFGHRLAIAALIMGGATTFYWLANLVMGLNAE